MGDALELSNHATGAGVLQRAPGANELDIGRGQLADRGLSDEERAAAYCRLGETLFYQGDRDAAVDCARAAFELCPRMEAVADFCAWLFSNCDCHREAAAAYERLLERRPGWAAGHRHASGSFAVADELDRVIFHAMQAREIEPGSVEFAHPCRHSSVCFIIHLFFKLQIYRILRADFERRRKWLPRTPTI